MVVQHIKIKGQIKDGKLVVDLPANVTDGEVILKLPVLVEVSENSLEERPLYSDGPGPCENDPYYLDSAVIVELMRTSIWDMALRIKRELAED